LGEGITRIGWSLCRRKSGGWRLASQPEELKGDLVMNDLKSNVRALAEVAPDPFDPASLRLDQSFASTSVKKLITTIPVGKPSKQDFVRVHPDPEYRLDTALIELKDDREVYVVVPELQKTLAGEWFSATLYLTINRQGVVRLWPVKLPAPDGKRMAWHESAAEAAELAMTRWLRVVPNMNLNAYEMMVAEITIPEPEWPNLGMREILKIACRDRRIDRLDHPVIKRLRGIS
jgi:hypothetical protein